MNYFGNRSTNASAESFNAKKAFRSQFRGVRNIDFFLFRFIFFFQYWNSEFKDFKISTQSIGIWNFT